MPEVELVIKMSEEEYKKIIEDGECDYLRVINAIENGALLPEGHGDLVEGDKEWVSVLDGPPSKDGRYYVTRHDYVTQTDFTDILWYEKGVWWNRRSIGHYAVTAWQLLPQPYKAESEDEK